MRPSHTPRLSHGHGGLELGWTNTPAPSESVGPDPAAAAAAPMVRRRQRHQGPGPGPGPRLGQGQPVHFLDIFWSRAAVSWCDSAHALRNPGGRPTALSHVPGELLRYNYGIPASEISTLSQSLGLSGCMKRQCPSDPFDAMCSIGFALPISRCLL